MESFHIKGTVLGNLYPFDDSAETFPQKMPWNDVGMMLHNGENNLVTGLNFRHQIALCHQIHGCRAARGEDNLVHALGVQKRSRLFAGSLIGIRRFVRQVMKTPMHIGIARLVTLIHRFQNLARLLGRSAIVQINQRLSMHLGGQKGKIGAKIIDVKSHEI